MHYGLLNVKLLAQNEAMMATPTPSFLTPDVLTTGAPIESILGNQNLLVHLTMMRSTEGNSRWDCQRVVIIKPAKIPVVFAAAFSRLLGSTFTRFEWVMSIVERRRQHVRQNCEHTKVYICESVCVLCSNVGVSGRIWPWLASCVSPRDRYIWGHTQIFPSLPQMQP